MADKQCRFPAGDGPGDAWDFCKSSVQKGSVYCPDHHKRCYTKITRKPEGVRKRFAFGRIAAERVLNRD